MQMSSSIFLQREWKEDEGRIRRIAQHYGSMYKSPLVNKAGSMNSVVQLVLFPEGTNMGFRSKAKSDAFADAHNRERFK